MTKAVGLLSDDTEDDFTEITESYKHREGSINERLAMMAAVRETGGRASSYR